MSRQRARAKSPIAKNDCYNFCAMTVKTWNSLGKLPVLPLAARNLELFAHMLFDGLTESPSGAP